MPHKRFALTTSSDTSGYLLWIRASYLACRGTAIYDQAGNDTHQPPARYFQWAAKSATIIGRVRSLETGHMPPLGARHKADQ